MTTQAVAEPTKLFERPARGQVAQTKKTIRDEISGDRFKMALAKILPKHVTADRIISVAISALTRNPDLAKCDPATFYQALMKLSALGLEPDGYQAHLIPFWNSKRNCFECVLIVDYKGLVEIAMRTGMFSQPPIAQVVRWNDDFVWDKGSVIRHVVDWKSDRGAVYAAYVIVKSKAGGEIGHVMSKDQIEDIRKRSKSPNKGPWLTDWDEMAKKTVFKQMSKWLPRSPEFRDTLEADPDIDQRRFEASRPIFDATQNAPAIEDREPEQLAERQEYEPTDRDDPGDQEARTEAEPSKEKPAAKPVQNYVKAVKGLLNLSGISEVDLISYLHQTGQLDEGIGTVAAMAEVAATTLQKCHDNWNQIATEVKTRKAA